jgi:hypothetical protein
MIGVNVRPNSGCDGVELRLIARRNRRDEVGGGKAPR